MAESVQKKETIWSLPFVILMAVNFFQSMASFMTNAILPVYAYTLGASAATVGIVASSFAVTALLIRPVAGPAFDSFSRKRLLLLSQVVITFSLMMYGIATNIPTIIGIRLLHGVAMGCSGPLALSLVSEFLPLSKFSSGISIYTLAQSCAQAIGPAIGLYFGATIGFQPAFFLCGAFLFVAIIGIVLVPEPPRKRLPYELKLSRMFAPPVLLEAAALTFMSTAFNCINAYVVLYGYLRGIADMGFYFIIYAGCLIATRPFFGKLADRFGAKRILIIAFIFFGTSYYLLSVAQDFTGFVIAAVVGSAGFGCAAPLLQSMALSSVPNELRGAASNTTFTGLDIGALVGPVIGGNVIELLAPVLGSEAAAYSDMWLIMLIPILCAFCIVIYWNIKPRLSQPNP